MIGRETQKAGTANEQLAGINGRKLIVESALRDKTQRTVFHPVEGRMPPQARDRRGDEGLYGRFAGFSGYVNGYGWAGPRLSARP